MPVEILAVGQRVERLGSLSAFTRTLCLAADGRVGVGITGVDGQHALACGDAGGFTAIVRQGDPSPRGGAFVDFSDCALPADGGVYFAATRLVTPDGRSTQDVYRATPDGIEWIVGSGAIATDGTPVREIVTLNGGNVAGDPVFEVNDRGTVLVRAWAMSTGVFMRVRADGAPEALRAPYGRGQPWIYGNRGDAGLAGDDTVLALATLASNEPGIVALDGEQVRVLFTLADVLADVGPIDVINPWFHSIKVRGEIVGFRLEYWTTPQDWRRRDVLYSPARGFTPVIDPALYDDIWLVDITAGGRALIVGYTDRPYPNFSDNVVVDDSGLTVVSRDSEVPYGFPDALALNDRGNVLFQTRTAPDSRERQSLALTGAPPDVAARCFVPPTAIEPTPAPTQTQTPAPTATPTATPVDCAVQPEACAHLRVGSAAGAPGERVTLAVTLDLGPWSVVGLQTDLRLLEQAPVAITETSEPACRINPAIDKLDSRFAFQPAGCTDDCTHVRAIVLAFDNLDPIPSGALVFECDLSIRATAAPAVYPLTFVLVEAADALGRATPIDGIAGALEVHAASDHPATGNAGLAGSGGDGCQVGPSPQHGMWLTLVLAAVALLLSTTRSSTRTCASAACDPTAEGKRVRG